MYVHAKILQHFFRVLYLRDDSVTDGNCLSDIMKNATKTLEDYYIAPPGMDFLFKLILAN